MTLRMQIVSFTVLVASALATPSCETSGSNARVGSIPVRKAELDRQIGSLNDPHSVFAPITSLLIDAHQRIYVVQPSVARITVFDSTGQFLHNIGRRGSGPGEFQFPVAIGRLGDSVWIGDGQLARSAVFGPAGNYVRSVQTPTTRDVIGGRPLMPARPASGGEFVALPMVRASDIAAAPLETPWLLVDAAGVVIDTVIIQHSQPRDALRVPVPNQNGALNLRQPIPDHEIIIPSPDGESFWSLDRRADGPRVGFAVTSVSLRGDTLLQRWIDTEAMPVTPSYRDSVVNTVFAGAGQGFPVSKEAIQRAMWVPRHRPAATAIVPIDKESAFVRIETTEGPSWLRIARRWDQMYRVRLPSDVLLAAALGNVLWAVSQDSLGVPLILRYRVVQ